MPLGILEDLLLDIASSGNSSRSAVTLLRGLP